MQRVHNWDCIIVEWATPLLKQPFLWGVTDCARLVRTSQTAIYGEDPWPLIPLWDSRAALLRVFSEFGSVEDQLRALGASRHVLTFAQSGDIVIAKPSPGEVFDSVCVVVADKLFITDEENGTSMAPLWAAPEQASVYRLP